jgi:hypothetical protein
MKIRMAHLDNHAVTEDLGLESEASQLASIYATIILNMRTRLAREAATAPRPKAARRNST